MKKGIGTKVFLALATLVIGMLLVVGCGEKEPPNDDDFINNLKTGLEKRWSLIDATASTGTNEEYRTYLNTLVDAEINAIGSLDEYVFTDSNLQSIAEQYVEALEKQKEGIPKYGLDDAECDRLFEVEGNQVRKILIATLYDDYSFRTTKNTDTLEEMVKEGYLLIEEKNKSEAIANLISEDLILSSTGSAYEMVLNNTTEYSLDSATAKFNFLDQSGTVVGTGTQYFSVAAGATVTISVSTYGVPEFDSVEMAISYGYTEGEETEYKKIGIENNMVINVTGVDFPKEVSTSNSWEGVTVTVEVSDVSIETSYWTDGTASGSITFKGTKTYDKNGETSTDSGRFVYKMMDQNGNLVATGEVFASTIMVGDTFTASDYVSDIEPGDYTVELYDYSY